jgi:phosphopantetheine--protein transferase-like protein
MATPETLQGIIATLLGTNPADVHPDIAFAGTRLQGSLARTRLYTAIEQQLGVACQAAYTARTYGELHAAIYGTAPAITTTQAAAAPSAPEQHMQHNEATPSIACGIDIEMVENLPVVPDYWSDAFYSTTFTPAEIAYCLLQDQPSVHFAARWCAKEALKKCDPAYLQADLRTLEVRLNASGAPYLCAVADGQSMPLPFAVSLSHTAQAAVAVVVKVPAMPGARSAGTPTVLPTVTAPRGASANVESRWQSAWLPLLMGSSALGLALWALVRTW